MYYLLLVTAVSAAILHQLPSAECIVVEDNTISYFKLPTASVLSSLGCNTGKFSGTFILKCPRSAAAATTLESGQSCAIVRGSRLVHQPAKHFWDLFVTTERGAAEDQAKDEPPEEDPSPPVDMVQKNFEERKERRRGHSVKGFHNIYHRDEFVQDHIFYDDLDHTGSFSNHGKNLHKE